MAATRDRGRAVNKAPKPKPPSVRDQFRVLAGVYNPHNFVSKFGKKNVDDYAMTYHPPGRASANKTTVWSPFRKLVPKGHWQDHGAKAFTGARRKSQAEALAWAAEHLKITEWVPCPADPTALIPKTVRDRGLAWLKKATTLIAKGAAS